MAALEGAASSLLNGASWHSDSAHQAELEGPELSLLTRALCTARLYLRPG